MIQVLHVRVMKIKDKNINDNFLWPTSFHFPKYPCKTLTKEGYYNAIYNLFAKFSGNVIGAEASHQACHIDTLGTIKVVVFPEKNTFDD